MGLNYKIIAFSINSITRYYSETTQFEILHHNSSIDYYIEIIQLELFYLALKVSQSLSTSAIQ